MSLKGKIVYFVLPLIVFVVGKMIHPVFYSFIVFYFIYCFQTFYLKWVFCIIAVFILAIMFFRVPKIQPITSVEGQVVSVDEESIVVQDGYEKVKVYGEFENIDIYDDIALTGVDQDISLPANDNAFCYQHYLYSLNIFHTLKLSKIQYHQKNNHIFHLLQQRVNQNEELSSLVSLFVLGTKDEHMEEFYEKLTDLSLVHLFALSGMHLTVLKKWLKQFLKFFFSDRSQDVIAVIFIGLYISIIPYNISFLRAYLMMMLPMIFHRFFNRMDIFSIVTIIMLFYNPYLIFNLSFIFSYSVYMFILLFHHHKKMKYLLLFSSIPIILSVNYKINIISLILSICLLPMVELIYKCILYYLILGRYVVPIVSFLFHCFEMITEFLYDHSFYLYFSKPPLFFIFVYYFLYLKIILNMNLKRNIQKEMSCLLGLLIAFYFYPLYNIQGKVVMINVGQGDCFFIKQPCSLGNVLIDTGGLKNRDLATDTIIPYLNSEGVKELDAVFISHDDFDHNGALDSLLKNFSVKKVIYDFEEIKIGHLLFQNLALDKDYEDKNDQSTVIYVKINELYYLFTGDISEMVEKDLYDTYKELKVDVLKVAHHGSLSSTSQDLMRLIQPKIALISVGKNNIYHHPHPDVIQRLNDYGIHIYRTDQTGMVSIVYYGKGSYIYQ